MKINRYGIAFREIPCAIQTSFGNFNRMFIVNNERIMKFYGKTTNYGECELPFQEEMYDASFDCNMHANELAMVFSDPLFQPANFQYEDVILVNKDKIVVFDGFCKFETTLKLDFFLESEKIKSLRGFKEYKLGKLPKLILS